jgi:hypothetical protein
MCLSAAAVSAPAGCTFRLVARCPALPPQTVATFPPPPRAPLFAPRTPRPPPPHTHTLSPPAAEWPLAPPVAPGDGSVVLDAGKNLAGVLNLTLTGPAGASVLVRYGELLYPNGCVCRGPWPRKHPSSPASAPAPAPCTCPCPCTCSCLLRPVWFPVRALCAGTARDGCTLHPGWVLVHPAALRPVAGSHVPMFSRSRLPFCVF